MLADGTMSCVVSGPNGFRSVEAAALERGRQHLLLPAQGGCGDGEELIPRLEAWEPGRRNIRVQSREQVWHE